MDSLGDAPSIRDERDRIDGEDAGVGGRVGQFHLLLSFAALPSPIAARIVCARSHGYHAASYHSVTAAEPSGRGPAQDVLGDR